MTNKVILMGRLTKDPDIRYTEGESSFCVARYTLAVERRFKREGQQQADFINCVAFGRQGEFAEKYLRKGMKICVVGRIQTGSYTGRDGNTVYTTDVAIEEQEFCESKRSEQSQTQPQPPAQAQPQQMKFDDDGFMKIPEGIENEFPF